MISSIFPVARKSIEWDRQIPQTNTRLQATLEKLRGFWPWDGRYSTTSTVASWDAPFLERKEGFGIGDEELIDKALNQPGRGKGLDSDKQWDRMQKLEELSTTGIP